MCVGYGQPYTVSVLSVDDGAEDIGGSGSVFSSCAATGKAHAWVHDLQEEETAGRVKGLCIVHSKYFHT